MSTHVQNSSAPNTDKDTSQRSSLVIILGHALGLGLTWGAWLWLASHPLNPTLNLIIAVGGTLAIIPTVLAGRWLLDRPTLFGAKLSVQRAERITSIVHYLIAILLGCAIQAAIRLGLSSPSWGTPLSPWLGLFLMAISGSALLLVIFTLLLKGMGLPFAIALTRVVVTDWIYAWTRNPIILSALAFLIGLGLWLQSSIFLVWLLVVVSPALLIFLKIYEERELELRFGDAYLVYKEKTPMLWPKRPRNKAKDK